MEQKGYDDINTYIDNTEYTANRYVMRCFTVTMIVYLATFLLNLFDIFTIEQILMIKAFVPSLVIYLIMLVIYKVGKPSDKWIKYLLLSSSIIVFMISGIFITYHSVLVTLLPFLYATLYSNKRLMWFVYILSVVSTIAQVYGGYYWGLCDANMVLLTTQSTSAYIENGKFILEEVNSNPILNLGLFFVLPRCLIYIAFMSVCTSIFRIVSGSLEKAKMTEEMEKLKDEAERANKAKSQFLARASHEIRTPINAIIGMNEMIIRECDNNEIKKYAYDTKASSIMLLSIINEILDSSKIESGKMEVVLDDYEIGSVFNDVYNMINLKAKEKGIDFKMDIDTTMPAVYRGDARMIRQILINLLNNAVKYTEKGNVELRCECKQEDNLATLTFSVIDTGIGIKEEDLVKLSEEFQRFDLKKNKNVEGTGLGMFIVKSFLNLMGSELKVKSEYGKGSEFSFELVQEIVDKNTLGGFMDSLNGAKEDEKEKIEYTAPKAKILVVDDYQMNLKVVRNLLKKTQMSIAEANSGEEAIQILGKEHFDIVFLDHMMPGMDGVETLKVIKDKALCENTPVIMLTANALVGNREKYLEQGFDDFVSKPIIPNKLDAVILKFLPKERIVINEKTVKDNSGGDKMGLTDEEMFEELKVVLPELDYSVVDSICCGDVAFYMEIFRDFVALPIKSELNKFYSDKDAKNYCIKVHGFKNNAYTIGAKALGDMAFKLEGITRAGDVETIESIQNEMFVEYDRICEAYKSKG